MSTLTTTNDTTTLTTSTMKSPLKCLHNEWSQKARADTNQLAVMQRMVLSMPGIQDIKWVELYDKFQLLVPVE